MIVYQTLDTDDDYIPMYVTGSGTSVQRPTEYEALRNIRWNDILRLTITSSLDLGRIDWKFILMVQHINSSLGRFAIDTVLQFDNPDIQYIVATRLDEPEWYVCPVMQEIFNKLLNREYMGLQAIPDTVPQDDLIRHQQLLNVISKRHNIVVRQKLDNIKNDVKL